MRRAIQFDGYESSDKTEIGCAGRRRQPTIEHRRSSFARIHSAAAAHTGTFLPCKGFSGDLLRIGLSVRLFLRLRAASHPCRCCGRGRWSAEKPAPKAQPASQAHGNTNDALRFNTLGVAYMNQQKFADAQKYFEQSLAADPKFSVARLNLGISLLSQQKLEPARAALEEASRQVPNDPWAWYNLGPCLQGFRRDG